MNTQPDIHTMIAQLTRTHTIGTPYLIRENGETEARYHYAKTPALLTQLEHAAPSSTGETNSGGYKSKPAARIDALDTLLRIDQQAAAWVRALGHDDPGTTVACVTKVGSLHPSAGHHADAIAADVRSWWNQARIITGYDSPAWRPDNTCPLCGEKGTLRIKLATETAMCVGCWETWSDAEIGLLAEHIKAENQDTDEETAA